eukprot:GHVQ01010128.1.p1 GENE.GHVQ01010128.1~~GHVQ01010128.1.p1  ORF type:complete len:3005 (+),score=324.99 GHVQ01010128.1:1-9015(+)
MRLGKAVRMSFLRGSLLEGITKRLHEYVYNLSLQNLQLSLLSGLQLTLQNLILKPKALNLLLLQLCGGHVPITVKSGFVKTLTIRPLWSPIDHFLITIEGLHVILSPFSVCVSSYSRASRTFLQEVPAFVSSAIHPSPGIIPHNTSSVNFHNQQGAEDGKDGDDERKDWRLLCEEAAHSKKCSEILTAEVLLTRNGSCAATNSRTRQDNKGEVSGDLLQVKSNFEGLLGRLKWTVKDFIVVVEDDNMEAGSLRLGLVLEELRVTTEDTPVLQLPILTVDKKHFTEHGNTSSITRLSPGESLPISKGPQITPSSRQCPVVAAAVPEAFANGERWECTCVVLFGVSIEFRGLSLYYRSCCDMLLPLEVYQATICEPQGVFGHLDPCELDEKLCSDIMSARQLLHVRDIKASLQLSASPPSCGGSSSGVESSGGGPRQCGGACGSYGSQGRECSVSNCVVAVSEIVEVHLTLPLVFEICSWIERYKTGLLWMGMAESVEQLYEGLVTVYGVSRELAATLLLCTLSSEQQRRSYWSVVRYYVSKLRHTTRGRYTLSDSVYLRLHCKHYISAYKSKFNSLPPLPHPSPLQSVRPSTTVISTSRPSTPATPPSSPTSNQSSLGDTPLSLSTFSSCPWKTSLPTRQRPTQCVWRAGLPQVNPAEWCYLRAVEMYYPSDHIAKWRFMAHVELRSEACLYAAARPTSDAGVTNCWLSPHALRLLHNNYSTLFSDPFLVSSIANSSCKTPGIHNALSPLTPNLSRHVSSRFHLSLRQGISFFLSLPVSTGDCLISSIPTHCVAECTAHSALQLNMCSQVDVRMENVFSEYTSYVVLECTPFLKQPLTDQLYTNPVHMAPHTSCNPSIHTSSVGVPMPVGSTESVSGDIVFNRFGTPTVRVQLSSGASASRTMRQCPLSKRGKPMGTQLLAYDGAVPPTLCLFELHGSVDLLCRRETLFLLTSRHATYVEGAPGDLVIVLPSLFYPATSHDHCQKTNSASMPSSSSLPERGYIFGEGLDAPLRLIASWMDVNRDRAYVKNRDLLRQLSRIVCLTTEDCRCRISCPSVVLFPRYNPNIAAQMPRHPAPDFSAAVASADPFMAWLESRLNPPTVLSSPRASATTEPEMDDCRGRQARRFFGRVPVWLPGFNLAVQARCTPVVCGGGGRACHVGGWIDGLGGLQLSGDMWRAADGRDTPANKQSDFGVDGCGGSGCVDSTEYWWHSVFIFVCAGLTSISNCSTCREQGKGSHTGSDTAARHALRLAQLAPPSHTCTRHPSFSVSPPDQHTTNSCSGDDVSSCLKRLKIPVNTPGCLCEASKLAPVYIAVSASVFYARLFYRSLTYLHALVDLYHHPSRRHTSRCPHCGDPPRHDVSSTDLAKENYTAYRDPPSPPAFLHSRACRRGMTEKGQHRGAAAGLRMGEVECCACEYQKTTLKVSEVTEVFAAICGELVEGGWDVGVRTMELAVWGNSAAVIERIDTVYSRRETHDICSLCCDPRSVLLKSVRKGEGDDGGQRRTTKYSHCTGNRRFQRREECSEMKGRSPLQKRKDSTLDYGRRRLLFESVSAYGCVASSLVRWCARGSSGHGYESAKLLEKIVDMWGKRLRILVDLWFRGEKQQWDSNHVDSVVEDLLFEGIIQTDHHRRSVFHWASWSGCKEIVVYLLSRFTGVSLHVINQPDSFNLTPLVYGVASGVEEVVRLLLHTGALPLGSPQSDYQNKTGDPSVSPLLYALQSGQRHLASILLSHIALLFVSARRACGTKAPSLPPPTVYRCSRRFDAEQEAKPVHSCEQQRTGAPRFFPFMSQQGQTAKELRDSLSHPDFALPKLWEVCVTDIYYAVRIRNDKSIGDVPVVLSGGSPEEKWITASRMPYECLLTSHFDRRRPCSTCTVNVHGTQADHHRTSWAASLCSDDSPWGDVMCVVCRDEKLLRLRSYCGGFVRSHSDLWCAAGISGTRVLSSVTADDGYDIEDEEFEGVIMRASGPVPLSIRFPHPQPPLSAAIEVTLHALPARNNNELTEEPAGTDFYAYNPAKMLSHNVATLHPHTLESQASSTRSSTLSPATSPRSGQSSLYSLPTFAVALPTDDQPAIVAMPTDTGLAIPRRQHPTVLGICQNAKCGRSRDVGQRDCQPSVGILLELLSDTSLMLHRAQTIENHNPVNFTELRTANNFTCIGCLGVHKGASTERLGLCLNCRHSLERAADIAMNSCCPTCGDPLLNTTLALHTGGLRGPGSFLGIGKSCDAKRKRKECLTGEIVAESHKRCTSEDSLYTMLCNSQGESSLSKSSWSACSKLIEMIQPTGTDSPSGSLSVVMLGEHERVSLSGERAWSPVVARVVRDLTDLLCCRYEGDFVYSPLNRLTPLHRVDCATLRYLCYRAIALWGVFEDPYDIQWGSQCDTLIPNGDFVVSTCLLLLNILGIILPTHCLGCPHPSFLFVPCQMSSHSTSMKQNDIPADPNMPLLSALKPTLHLRLTFCNKPGIPYGVRRPSDRSWCISVEAILTLASSCVHRAMLSNFRLASALFSDQSVTSSYPCPTNGASYPNQFSETAAEKKSGSRRLLLQFSLDTTTCSEHSYVSNSICSNVGGAGDDTTGDCWLYLRETNVRLVDAEQERFAIEVIGGGPYAHAAMRWALGTFAAQPCQVECCVHCYSNELGRNLVQASTCTVACPPEPNTSWQPGTENTTTPPGFSCFSDVHREWITLFSVSDKVLAHSAVPHRTILDSTGDASRISLCLLYLSTGIFTREDLSKLMRSDTTAVPSCSSPSPTRALSQASLHSTISELQQTSEHRAPSNHQTFLTANSTSFATSSAAPKQPVVRPRFSSLWSFRQNISARSRSSGCLGFWGLGRRVSRAQVSGSEEDSNGGDISGTEVVNSIEGRHEHDSQTDAEKNAEVTKPQKPGNSGSGTIPRNCGAELREEESETRLAHVEIDCVTAVSTACWDYSCSRTREKAVRDALQHYSWSVQKLVTDPVLAVHKSSSAFGGVKPSLSLGATSQRPLYGRWSQLFVSTLLKSSCAL